MQCFTYKAREKRDGLTITEASSEIKLLAGYLVREHQKGKVPLIIAGAGTSASDLERLVQHPDEEPEIKQYANGLPCLDGMIRKLAELVTSADADSEEMKKLKDLFGEVTSLPEQGVQINKVDREWIGKAFGALSESTDKSIQNIWSHFCNWFFFKCCKAEDGTRGGALNISTSKAAKEIAELCGSVGAVCLSANFDDFLEYALTGIQGAGLGISLFSKKAVDNYFRRNRRNPERFSEPPHNYCVLHANGDVLWLHCSGDEDDGFCPRRGKYFPAFNDRRHINQDNILKCRVCGSSMKTTMTMPGTYQKDYNTRQIISSIWEHLASRISCVITVGLSCDWDEVLLKFILGLLLEREIPHLDINNLSSAAHNGESEIIRRVVRERRFQSLGVCSDAAEGIRNLNGYIEKIQEPQTLSKKTQQNGDMPPFFNELVSVLEEYSEIQHLKHISQLGLKAVSAKTGTENDRWEHSKEVAGIAYQLYKRLCENSGKDETPFEQALLCAAGLLHDCGHLPFSHLLEDVFEELSWGISDTGESFKHSQYSRILIHRMCSDKDSKLREILERNGITPNEVVQVIEGRYGVGYIDTLINGAVDADKIAYIFTDAEQMQRALMLKKDEFINKLTENAFITQEGFISLDSTSAWYAMRLLDERKRMYDELYLNPHMRCMEAAAKHIITTYFVQKYNVVEFDAELRKSVNASDLGGYRIMLAIDDMIRMEQTDFDQLEPLSASVGKRTMQSLKSCMDIVQELVESSEEALIKEWNLLQKMYYQLTGIIWEKGESNHPELLNPYQDEQIQEMASRLAYQQLSDVRKRIILNYPGMVLVDLYKPIQFYSIPAARRRHRRLDGTFCAQDTMLVPDSKRTKWQDKQCLASIPLSEYVQNYEKNSNPPPIFQVFRIGDNQVDCEHAIDMLKKEMQKQLGKGGNRP